jgi:transposase
LDNEQIRLLLHFQKGLDLNASEAARNICKVYGEGIVAERTVRKWFKIFREESDRLTDNPRSGRPREVNRHAVIEAIEENPSMTTRMLAEDFDCHHSTIEEILHEAGKN